MQDKSIDKEKNDFILNASSENNDIPNESEFKIKKPHGHGQHQNILHVHQFEDNSEVMDNWSHYHKFNYFLISINSSYCNWFLYHEGYCTRSSSLSCFVSELRRKLSRRQLPHLLLRIFFQHGQHLQLVFPIFLESGLLPVRRFTLIRRQCKCWRLQHQWIIRCGFVANQQCKKWLI